jgi:hypothetical protein
MESVICLLQPRPHRDYLTERHLGPTARAIRNRSVSHSHNSGTVGARLVAPSPYPGTPAHLASLHLFVNFTSWVWVTVLSEVLRRLITPLRIKYADNIMKGFTTSLPIVISFLASLGLLRSFHGFRYHCYMALLSGMGHFKFYP